MAIILRWRYTPQVGAGDVTSLAAIVGPRGLGIASQSFNAETGVYTFTMTDGSTETVDFSGYTDSLEAIQTATEALRDQAQGYATAAGAVAGFFDFADLATLQADTSLTYTAGQDGTVVSGDIIRRRDKPYAYQVLAPDAASWDVQNSNGTPVKLQFLPTANGYEIPAFGSPVSGVYPAAVVQKAFDAANRAGGGVVYMPDGAAYDSPFAPADGEGYFDEINVMTYDNITLRGVLPKENATLTALEGGSVWRGSLFFAADNFNWDNLGIDVGADWCAANNSSNPQEGLISINRENAGYAAFSGGDPARIGGKARGNLLVLCKGTGRPAATWGGGDAGDVSNVHAVLLENDHDAVCTGVMRSIFGGAGIVLKSSNCDYRGGWKVERCWKYGQGLIKSEDYSAANNNTIRILRGANHVTDNPTVTDITDYEQNAFSFEAATADCVGNVVVFDGAYAPINGIEFKALTGQVCEGNKAHVLGSFDDCYSYPVLTNGAGTVRNNTVYGLKGKNALAGALVQSGHSLKLVDPDFEDARQYSFRANGTGTLDVSFPRSKTDALGHFFADTSAVINVLGGVRSLTGEAPTQAGAGVVNGVRLEPQWFGSNIFTNGDCETVSPLETASGSTSHAIVSGGHVGNALEITRVGAPAGYATRQFAVEVGKTYTLDLYFKNGTGSGRLFVGRTSLASGEYTGGTFVALSNAAWTKHTVTFKATTVNLFVTVQIATAAGTTFLLDELELRTVLPTYANNAAALAGGLAVGDTYKTGGDPDLIAVVV